MDAETTRERRRLPYLLRLVLAHLRSLAGRRRYRPEKAYMRGGNPRRASELSVDDSKSD